MTSILMLLLCTHLTHQDLGKTIVDIANAPCINVKYNMLRLTRDKELEIDVEIRNTTMHDVYITHADISHIAEHTVYASKGIAFKLTVTPLEGIVDKVMKPSFLIKSGSLQRIAANIRPLAINAIAKNGSIDPLLLHETRNDVVYSLYSLRHYRAASGALILVRCEGAGVTKFTYTT